MKRPEWSDPAFRCLNVVGVASFLRAAMFEGAALFGLVNCLLGVATGAIRTQPLYWLNALSSLVLLVLIAMTFPTRDNLLDTFRLNIEATRELRSATTIDSLRR